MAVIATGFLGGCPRSPPTVGHSPASPKDAGREAIALIPAARCGECHGKMESEWRRSAHARSAVSPLYLAMRAGAPAAACDRCHAPLRAVAPSDPTASEGVTCDVCHTIASVPVGQAGGAGFTMHLEDSVRYGPLCDTKPHYFHTMGCSPLHQEAEFCAACHDWRIELPAGGTLAVFPEFSEWRDEPSALGGQSCQLCHMPGENAEVAVGSRKRASVRNHGFGLRGELLGRALTGRATVTAVAEKLHVAVALTNSGAGHYVPTGLPERRLLIAVEALDSAGRILTREEHSYGRVLVDAADHEVPFYLATRQRTDTRIRPGQTRSDTFAVVGPSTGRLRVRVSWQPIPPALAAQLGVAPPPDEPMLSASLPLPWSRRRAGEAVVMELLP